MDAYDIMAYSSDEDAVFCACQNLATCRDHSGRVISSMASQDSRAGGKGSWLLDVDKKLISSQWTF